MSRQARIALIGGDGPARAEIIEVLAAAGFSDVTEADTLAALGECRPDLLILAPDTDAALYLAQARDGSLWLDVPILAIAPPVPPTVATALLAAGADEILRGPPMPAILGARLRGLLRRRSAETRARELENIHAALRQVTAAFSSGGDAPETLRAMLLTALQTVGFERASLIAHVEASERAYVIAATDDPSLSQFCLLVADYPELAKALRTGEPVLIADTFDHPVTAGVVETLRQRQVRALAVFPCRFRGQGLGALLFRKSQPGLEQISPGAGEFARLLAGMVAAELRHSHIIQKLREDTRRISRASYEAERRLRTIESLKEHFEASSDGVVVLDDAGRILFVNGAAESITGFARDGLIGSPLIDLVPEDQSVPLGDVIRSVLSGNNIEAFDLDLGTTSGEPICVSVTTSTVLAKSGAVILSFRNVTGERALESELQHTKDFLEKLIDSAVDGIIAADMHGRLILFNPGAERIYGHRAEDVLGRLPVWKLYPDGVARRIMQMLRAEAHGGVGRLEQTRLEVLTAAGQLVPINMTASILYENDREAATVGILSDLRERLQMEERLRHVQEQLEFQERQAMVAQLAGAAAHELNQPLTSILGYAQLIERQSGPDAPHDRMLQVILREAQRMAEIVRKIGRITRFETREYVGSASIMDLEKSAASSQEFLTTGDGSGDLGDDDDTDDVTQVAGPTGALSPELAPLVAESPEDEVTSQHLVLATPPTPPGPDPGTGDQVTGDETADPVADRIAQNASEHSDSRGR